MGISYKRYIIEPFYGAGGFDLVIGSPPYQPLVNC